MLILSSLSLQQVLLHLLRVVQLEAVRWQVEVVVEVVDVRDIVLHCLRTLLLYGRRQGHDANWSPKVVVCWLGLAVGRLGLDLRQERALVLGLFSG